MTAAEPNASVGVGEPAPDFKLPAAQGGEISLSDYRGKRHVLLLFLHGMTCPFCRRHLAQVRLSYPKITARDAEVVAVTATTRDRAPQYQKLFSFVHPYLCDPDSTTARRYGLPASKAALMVGMMSSMLRPAVWREMMSTPGELRAQPEKTESEALISGRMDGLFVVDREGVVRFARTTLNPGLVPSMTVVSGLLAELSG